MSTKEGGEERYVHISQRTIIYSVLFIAFLATLFYMRDLVYVFLSSIVIASFVEGGVKRMKKIKIERTLAVIIIYFLTLGILGTLLYFFVPLFVDQFAGFAAFLQHYLPHSNSLGASGDISFSSLLTDLQAFSTGAEGSVLQTAVAIFGSLFNLVVLIVLSFYLSINDKAIESFLRIVTPNRDAEYVADLWNRTEHKIGLWFQGQLLLGLVVGILIYFGLLIFDIQYPLILAIMAAILELIPFGIILAAIPAVAAAYMGQGGTGAIEVAALYFIIHQIELNFIAPLVVQKVVGISSLIVILALLVGLKLAGFWGLLISIPAAVLLMEFLSDVKKRKGLLT